MWLLCGSKVYVGNAVFIEALITGIAKMGGNSIKPHLVKNEVITLKFKKLSKISSWFQMTRLLIQK
jgi:hypothetical protein